MKNFECPSCRNKVYFENVSCVKCGAPLGFDAETMMMVTFKLPVTPRPQAKSSVKSPAAKTGAARHRLHYCANAAHGVCNWLTSDDGPERCLACQMNRTIPNLAEPGSLTAWRDLERAKKRLVYGLLRFGLPLAPGGPAIPHHRSNQGPLTFDFTRNTVTGHREGVITINVLEADAVERERQRQRFGEPYRALLGHLRHESGHFYWTVLVEAAGQLDGYRRLFGDERQDYAGALARHHTRSQSGPGPAGNGRTDWQGTHVSAYASAHPWEDWAETWAHYLHLVDAVDTAEAEGMEPRASGFSLSSIFANKRPDVYAEATFAALIERWTPLAIGLNSLSRSIGHDDFYPFVIAPQVVEKLAFVHQVVRAAGR
jgi:hypothetical protein